MNPNFFDYVMMVVGPFAGVAMCFFGLAIWVKGTAVPMWFRAVIAFIMAVLLNTATAFYSSLWYYSVINNPDGWDVMTQEYLRVNIVLTFLLIVYVQAVIGIIFWELFKRLTDESD